MMGMFIHHLWPRFKACISDREASASLDEQSVLFIFDIVFARVVVLTTLIDLIMFHVGVASTILQRSQISHSRMVLRYKIS